MDWNGIIQLVYGKVAVSLIILLAGFIIAKITGKVVKRILAEAELNRILTAAGFKPMSDALGALVEFALYLATVIIILQQYGLATITLWIIGIVAVIVIFFSLTLTVRDFIPNFIVGMVIRKKLKAKLGKQVTFGMISGKLEQVGIVASTIRNADEQYVPHLYASKYI